VTTDIRERALRLLRLLNDQQAEGQTNKTVMPDNAAAADAGLQYLGSDSCEAALGWLLEEGALAPDHTTNERLSFVVGASKHGHAFKITPHGMSLLQQQGE
jgi:hypothetical protein